MFITIFLLLCVVVIVVSLIESQKLRGTRPGVVKVKPKIKCKYSL